MSGPLPRFLAPLTIPASWLYGAAITSRNARYDRNIGIESIDRPVISVGNMTTGGTGKTPMVMWIANMLREADHRPVIAMRGYKSVNGMSDEQAEYAERLPDVPVLANPDRVAALREFLSTHPEIDCVLLDDGFQHRQLKRDLDLVLIDASSDTLTDRLLPAGNLREPLANLRRADAVILTHCERPSPQIESQITNLHGRRWLASSHHVWSSLAVHESETVCYTRAIDWLAGKRILTILGVGKPQSIHEQLAALGAEIVGDGRAKDHQRFTREEIAWTRIELELGPVGKGGPDAMLVTAKDWVKLRDLIDWSAWPVPVVVPRLELSFVSGEDRLRKLILSKTTAGTPM